MGFDVYERGGDSLNTAAQVGVSLRKTYDPLVAHMDDIKAEEGLGQITRSLVVADHAVEELYRTVEILEAKLSPVMYDGPAVEPTDPSPDDKEIDANNMITRRLLDLVAGIKANNVRIIKIIDRLEV